MATTPNFSWPTPDNTDLVRDGAEAIRDLGNAIDSTVDGIDQATTKGDLLVYDGTDYQRLGVGADGEVLFADDLETTGLKWDDPPKGGMTVIATGTMSGAAVTISSIPNTFKYLQLDVEGVTQNTDPSRNLDIRFNNDSSANYGQTALNSGATTLTSANAANEFSGMLFTNGSVENHNFVMHIYNYTQPFRNMYWASASSAGPARRLQVFGLHRGSGALNRIDIIARSSSFNGGTYILYGVE